MKVQYLTGIEMSRNMRDYSGPKIKRELWKLLKSCAINPGTIMFEVYENGSIYVKNQNDPFMLTPVALIQEDSNLIHFTNYILNKNMASVNPNLISVDINKFDPYSVCSTVASEWQNCNKVLSEIATNCSKIAEKEEKKNMFNFDFGKITSDNVRISMYGIAVKNMDGRYVSYDTKTHSVMDVEILNMPANDFLYKMPVAIKDVKAGDVVIHNRVPMFVVETHESTMKVIDIREGTEKEIYLTKSPFNFNFAVKVVSLMDMTDNKASEENPFGAMLPFLMLGDDKNADPMMIMLASSGKMDMSNPMMMYFLMKDSNRGNDMLPLLMMMNMKN